MWVGTLTADGDWKQVPISSIVEVRDDNAA